MPFIFGGGDAPMINTVKIKNFKSIQRATMPLKNVTIFTGPNSSGKSTALLALLTPIHANLQFDAQSYINQRLQPILPFDEPETSTCEIELSCTGKKAAKFFASDGIARTAPNKWENTVSFLCADRMGPRDSYDTDHSNKFDILGTQAFTYFEEFKNKPIEPCFVHSQSEMETLGGQVNFWLKYILNTQIFTTKKENNPNSVTVAYSQAGQPRISPLLTGFGTSTLVPVIIFCLAAKLGDTVIIENPEIHLHPLAQSRLADFLSFVGERGVQTIIETHCEHLIYRLCYNVKDTKLSKNNLIFYYKEKPDSTFLPIMTNEQGRFIDSEGNYSGFPAGFFDATLQDYLSIY